MGLIDFVKEAGAKLVGADKDDEKDQQPAARSYTREEAEQANARRQSFGLMKMVESLGIQVEALAIRVDGDVATVAGTVADQETREKLVLVVGNTVGIARVEDKLLVEDAAPEATFHTVVSGDTLGGIAKTYYGNAGKYPVIFEANKPMLTDPDKIYPGQVLRIPPAD